MRLGIREFAILFAIRLASANLQLCLNREEVKPKRFATTRGNPVPLTLGVSERITHQLATHVYYIFLKEVLGYPDVRIININQSNLTQIFHNLSAHTDIPQYMVDLEVWIPPENSTIHLSEKYSVKECGNIAPPGRYGWFIPKILFQPYHQKWKHVIHWDIFLNLNTSLIFTMSKENLNVVLSYAKKNDSKGYYCEEEWCTSGVYVPPWCEHQNCPVLIAEYAGKIIINFKELIDWQGEESIADV